MLACAFTNEPSHYSHCEQGVMDKPVNLGQSHQWVVQQSSSSQRGFEYLQPTYSTFQENLPSPLIHQMSPPIVKVECVSPPCPRYCHGKLISLGDDYVCLLFH